MIYANETIVDPVGYVEANPEIIDTSEPISRQLVSGTNIDMLAHYTTDMPYHFAGGYNTPASPVLGGLYMQGRSDWSEFADGYLQVQWLPSPLHANHIAEVIGRRPGVDVLSITHARPEDMKVTGQIYNEPYAEYLANGYFPQSTSHANIQAAFYFYHDRTDDHATAVILAPELFTRYTIDRAKNEGGAMVGYFDKASGRLCQIMNYLWPSIVGEASTISPQPLEEHLDDLRVLDEYMQGQPVCDDECTHINHDPDAYARISELIMEHLIALRPQIVAQKARAQV